MQNTPVLVVDDEWTVCDYVARFLSSRGYVVDCASSGEEAVARLKRGKYPSLMILDLLLPGLSGLELLEYVKKTGSAIPVIILSSERQTRTVVQAIKLGAADYLVKPFENEELEFSVKTIMERQSLLREISSLRRQLADNYAGIKITELDIDRRQVSYDEGRAKHGDVRQELHGTAQEPETLANWFLLLHLTAKYALTVPE